MEFRALGNHDLLNEAPVEQFGGLAIQADGLSFNDRTFVPRDCTLNLRRMVVLQTAPLQCSRRVNFSRNILTVLLRIRRC